jgi:hypothetical protein
VLLAAVAVGQSARSSTIPVSEIRPGMRGHGLTVFRGTTPERFDVEVIDVLHNFRPDMDLILVRTDHPILDHASTVAGMSGSPIYLDGRLAGAYAYGWPFGKDPIAGVTPIAAMLHEMRRPVRPDSFPGAEAIPGVSRRSGARRPRAVAGGAAPARFAGLPAYRGGGGEARTALDPLRAHAARTGPVARTADPRGMQRASTPLMLGGFTDATANQLGDLLEPFGFVTLQAGGSAADGSAGPQSFSDGGAIGVQLIRGDVTATAIGTITHVGRRRLVAFGHPMMNAGEIGLPTSTARVLHILASQSRSFKIAEAIGPRGTLVHDRQSAIVVDTELEAATVPVTLRIHGIEGAPRTEWRMEVASHRILTPVLAFAGIANALGATASDQTDVIFTAEMRVHIEGHGTVELEDKGYMSSGPNDAPRLSRLRMFELMEIAYGNPFEESRVLSAEVDLHVRFARDLWEIVDASVAAQEVDPGAQVNVHVVLRRFGQADRVRVVPVRVPTHAAGEQIELRMADMIHNVQRRWPSTSLAVSTKMPTRGLQFEGHVVRDLPPSALDALQLVNDSGRGTPFVTYDRQAVDVGEVLSGSARLRLQVRETPRR